MRRFDTPGLSMAFVRGKTLLHAGAYGWADQQKNLPVTPQSRFRIASNSKALTSAAIFTLIESQHLRLGDRVFAPDGLLPEFSEIGTHRDWLHAITLHHLLTHTAGGWSNEQNDPMFEMLGLNHSQLIRQTLQNYPLMTQPGERYAYSNFGYCVLGRVIEKAGGEPYARYVQDHILNPAGVREMQIAAREPAAGEVHYYSHDSADPYAIPIARMDSHGGWIATPTDVAHWVASLFSTQDRAGAPIAISESSLSDMTKSTRANPEYACGWLVNSAGNCWHVGLLSGTTHLMVHTATGFSWAAALNTRSPDGNAVRELDDMMWQIFKVVTH